MPTGQAHTRRRMPPIADAKPKTLPTISRQKMAWPAMLSWASKSRSKMFMPCAPLPVPWAARPRRGEQALDVLGDDVDLEVDGVADALVAQRGQAERGGDQRDGEASWSSTADDGEGDAVDGDRALLARRSGRPRVAA